MFNAINAGEIKGFYGLGDEEFNTEAVEVLYAVSDGTKAYVLLKEKATNDLYENIGEIWNPQNVTVFSMIKAMSTDEIVQEVYLMLPDFIQFLKELQSNTKSVVEDLIGEAKGFSPEELKAWMSNRSDIELEELGSFAGAVLSYVQGTINDRAEFNEDDDYEEDEEE